MIDRELDPLYSILAELAAQGRAALLPALHAAQQCHGWIPEAVATEVGRALGVPLADVYGVIDFYQMLSREPMGRTVARVCNAPVCALAGSDELTNALCRHLKVAPGEVSSDGEFTVDHAPALLVGETALGQGDSRQAAEICARRADKPISFVGGDIRILTGNCGRGHPASFADYSSGGGYAGLKKALTMAPQDVIAELKTAGLVGR